MKRNGNDEIACERFAVQTFLQSVAKPVCQRYTVGVFQMMDDLAKRVREQQGRSGKVERVFATKAESTESFNCRRGFAALSTKRRFQGNQAGPTFRTCPSPPALQNWSVTYDTRDGEQEIENEIEQSAFGETQRANTVYNNYFEYGKLWIIESAR